MSENTNVSKEMNVENTNPSQDEALQADYRATFIPTVHRIGRGTMFMEIIVSLLPIAYLWFVRGDTMPIVQFFAPSLSIAPMLLSMWLTEPITYWPVLGSAGTYISYFSGNVSSMRFPVAVTVQREMKADINTPRGQVATIVGIVGSVVSAIVILLIIVLAGSFLLSILPQAVIDSFDFLMVAMVGAMVVMNVSGQFMKRADGTRPVKEGLTNVIAYMGCGLLVTWLISTFLPSLATVGMLVCIVVALLIAYIRYRIDLKKAAVEA